MDKIMCDCGHPESDHSDITRGYGIAYDGLTMCYGCCALDDIATMDATGAITLYLVGDRANGYRVTNWPGSLVFDRVTVTTGRHNIAGKRYDAWFNHGGHVWHGVRYGDNTEAARFKRTKKAARLAR